jgi:hypothetical protein
LRWSKLSPLERAAAFDAAREFLDLELRGHPDQAISLELTELPADLRDALDDLAASTGRFTFSVVDVTGWEIADDTA